MKKCPNCGREYDDSVKFCAECGSAVEAAVAAEAVAVNQEASASPQTVSVSQTTPVSQVQKKKAPKKKMNKGLKIGLIVGAILAALSVMVVAVIIAIVLLFVIIRNQDTTLDMNDYVVHSFSGYETAGQHSAYVDADKFIEDYTEASKLSYEEALYQAYYIYSRVSVEVDRTEGLINGEEIGYYVLVDMDSTVEEYLDDSNIYLNYYEYDYVEVNGLLPITYVNPFDYITITQEGVDGNIYIDVEKDASQPINNIIGYNVSQYYNLSIGDVVTISIDNYYLDLALQNGYGITKVSMEYTVGDADKYYSDVNDMSDDALENFKKDTLAKINGYLESYSSYFTGSDVTYAGTYVLVNKDNFYRNYIIPVYSVNITSVDGDFEPATVYMSYIYYNAVDRIDDEDEWYEYSWNIEGYSGLYYGWFSQVRGYATMEQLYDGEISGFVNDSGYEITATEGLFCDSPFCIR